MDEQLYEILSQIAPTYHFTLNGQPDTAILFRLYMLNEYPLEGGRPLSETRYYRVALLMKQYDATFATRVRTALKDAGWCVQSQEQQYDPENKYFEELLDISKWRRIK